MSRRIAYLFAVAASATVAMPAGADPECFDSACRMPQVIEAPETQLAPPQPQAGEDKAAFAKSEPQPIEQRAAEQRPAEHSAAEQRLGPPPESVRPQMRVDQLPRPSWRPLPDRPVEQTVAKPVEKKTVEKPVQKPAPQAVRQVARPAPLPLAAVEPIEEPVEVVARRYAAPEPQAGYVPPQVRYVQPSANVVVVAPGAQYGEDGVVVANGRQDSSWQLCQVDRPGPGHNRCIQYNYQPYGAYGYRPLGTYKAYKASPSYVYVPDAKIITLD